MKRTIKFRAWHNESLYMVTSDRGVYTALQHALNVSVGSGFSDIDTSATPDKYTLMQYTGLKDKNGKEIYEGDILQINTDKPMVVNWSIKFASFVLNRDGWAFSHWFGESCEPGECEVIGNIYETPELINY